MEDKLDELKGRTKEAAGDLTGDKELQREGERDQAGAKVKGAANDAKDKVEGLVDKAKDALNRK